MLLQWSAPEYVPRSFLVSGVSGTNKAVKQTDTSFRLTKQVADGLVDMQEVSKGLFLVQSEMAFKKETELCEEYPERKVFQLSFCMNGVCEWDYRQKRGEHYQLSPTQCSLQCGTFSKCVSHFSSEQPYRTLSISLEQERFPSLSEDLEAAHLIRRDDKICTHVFSTTPEIRLVLQQLLDCPPERKLRKLYLEGKVLELLSLFCDEAIGKQKNTKDISREDYRCLMKAREIIDNHFLHPLKIAQIAEQCFLSETKLKQGFKICFNCTVYEYIVEKRMEMAYRLLQSGKYKVKDVVWLVGYTNASHFIDAFKKRYGVTPGEI